MADVIVIGGAPGSGKSTLARRLHAHLHSPWIDFGRIREFHLERDWSNQSEQEEGMSFENLLFILRNYKKHGYTNVVIDDLRDHRVIQMPSFTDLDVRVVTLLVNDQDELRRRISERNRGWRDGDRAVEWNRRLREREESAGEFKLDVTGLTPDEVFRQALQALGIEDRDIAQQVGGAD